jgi:hypothetical protein
VVGSEQTTCRLYMEIVLHKNGSRKVLLLSAICKIEKSSAVKYLCVCFNGQLSFINHVDRFHLFKQLQKQDVELNGLNIVFNSMV